MKKVVILFFALFLGGLTGCQNSENEDEDTSEKSLDYDGDYNGIVSSSGVYLGAWEMSVSEGLASGYYDDGEIWIDFSGTVYEGGKLDFEMTLTDETLVDVSMTIDNSGNLTGTWSDSDGESGLLSGSEATTTFDGDYSGQALTDGSSIGSWQMNIENGIVQGEYTEDEESIQFSGYVSKDGKLAFGIEFSDGVIASINATISNGNVAGTWSNTDGLSGSVSGSGGNDGTGGDNEDIPGVSTYIWIQDDLEVVEPNEDLGFPFLNSDNSLSYLTLLDGDLNQNIRYGQTGAELENDYLLSSTQEQELLTLLDVEGKETLDNGHTVRFAAETVEGSTVSEDSESQFYIYMYVNDGSTDIDRIQIQSIGSLEIVSSSIFYMGRLLNGYVTYSDDNEIHYSYTYKVNDSGVIQYKVGFIVINDQYEVVLSAELDKTFEHEVLTGPVRGVTGQTVQSATVINTSSSTPYIFPAKRGINTLGSHLSIIRPPSGNFYYVVAPIDHNPSTKDGNQIVLKADVRTYVYRYELNGTATWEYVFNSHLPTQSNQKWFYLDRFLFASNDGLVYDAQLNVNPPKRALLHIHSDGTVNELFMSGYLHSFNELSDGKIAFSGHAPDNNVGAFVKFTGVVNSDLSFEVTNTENLSEFLY